MSHPSGDVACVDLAVDLRRETGVVKNPSRARDAQINWVYWEPKIEEPRIRWESDVCMRGVFSDLKRRNGAIISPPVRYSSRVRNVYVRQTSDVKPTVISPAGIRAFS